MNGELTLLQAGDKRCGPLQCVVTNVSFGFVVVFVCGKFCFAVAVLVAEVQA